MISDTFLSDAGSWFFAAWTAVVSSLSIAVFARDVIRPKSDLSFPPHSGSSGAANPVARPKLRPPSMI